MSPGDMRDVHVPTANNILTLSTYILVPVWYVPDQGMDYTILDIQGGKGYVN